MCVWGGEAHYRKISEHRKVHLCVCVCVYILFYVFFFQIFLLSYTVLGFLMIFHTYLVLVDPLPRHPPDLPKDTQFLCLSLCLSFLLVIEPRLFYIFSILENIRLCLWNIQWSSKPFQRLFLLERKLFLLATSKPHLLLSSSPFIQARLASLACTNDSCCSSVPGPSH